MSDISDIQTSLSMLAVTNANRIDATRTITQLTSTDPYDAGKVAGFQTQVLPADNDVPAFTIEIDNDERTSARVEADVEDRLTSLMDLFYRGDKDARDDAIVAATQAFSGLIKQTVQDTDEDIDSIQIRLGTLTTDFGQGTQGISGFTGLVIQGNVVRDGLVKTSETVFVDLEGQTIGLPESSIFEGFPTGVYEKTVSLDSPLTVEEQQYIFDIVAKNTDFIRSAISDIQSFNSGDAEPIIDALNQIADKSLFVFNS